MNWEAILIAAVPGFLALVGVLYNEYRKRKVAREESDTNLQVRREPTWNEVVAENRQLRSDLSKLETVFDTFRGEVREFKKTIDARDQAFANVLGDAANQWPATHEGPVFAQEDLGVLGDTIPPVWRRRVRPAIGGV